MNNLYSIPKITDNPEIHIEFMCYNLLISIDNQVLNLSFKPMKEQLVGGSFGYYCNGRFRSNKWIDEHKTDVLGLIEN